jgi:flagellar basal body-associated protein FliL
MGRSVVVALLALVGLLCAAGMGYAAYVVSRGSVAVPVTRLQPEPRQLAPARAPRVTTTRKRVTTPTGTTGTTTTATTTVDDHSGNRGPGGDGDDNSGHGGGGHGGDD